MSTLFKRGARNRLRGELPKVLATEYALLGIAYCVIGQESAVS